MERIQKEFEISVPVRAAYDQWTQFEEFPRFMDGVEEVVQTDNTHLHWRVSVAGKQKEWDAEITEQVPDRVIAWRSVSGTPNAGQVRFEPIGTDRTRVMFAMEYQPETVVEKAGDAVGVLSRKVDKTVEDFKEFIEQRGRETGGWRGEVHQGEAQDTTAERMAHSNESGSSSSMGGSSGSGMSGGSGSGMTGGSTEGGSQGGGTMGGSGNRNR
jgi:ribosome-associated toxin RatA of RatAB toxin-antitoxin module